MERPVRIKTIGILGGMSDQATAEYYRLINAAVNERLGGWDIAETLIAGCNFGNIEHFVRNDLWEEAGEYLAGKARALERAGADLLVCVSNTAHRVSDRFCAGLGIPFLHIADPTGAAIRAAGLSRVALLGTKATMSAPFLRDYYSSKFGIDIVVPDEEGQVLVNRVIWDELVRGAVTQDSKQAILRVCDRLRAHGAQGVILGCTELFLLIVQADRPDFPMFDTTSLHVAAIVEQALSTT
ncbi:MAG: aspartate/glutamate racemase family protein [Gammaproteobacteria bacterium]|nr:aspartate/glutamate racemase family protein [Gammaproteobacteria bacterium]